jgi:hypothetical protein
MTSVTTRPSARIVPVALAGVLVLGACGSDEPDADGGDSVPSAEDGLLAPTPVRTVGGGSGGGAAVAATESADSRMATDMMMPYRIMNFVLADGLPALPGNDVGFVFQVGQQVTAEQVAALAAQLGVTGEPVRIDEGYSVSWRVGPDDGTAPSVWVYEDAMLSWSYNWAWATAPSYGGCVVAGSAGSDGSEVAVEDAPDAAGADDVTVADEPAVDTIDPAVSEPVETCAEPEPPTGVPTADEAQAKATELIGALGLDPAAFTFETPYADEWSAFAGATEKINGVATGRRVDVGFGAEGEIQYAGGQLATPQQMGPYPLIGIDEALERLNDTSGFYGGGYGMMDLARSSVGGGDVAVSSDVAVATTDSGEAAPPVDVTIDPMPVETLPPEEVTVTLTDVEADVWWAWDVDGSAYLLPAYRFIGDDGGWYTVPAVTDEFLIQAEPDEVPVPETMPPVTIEPVPVETVPVETVPVESVPVESVPVETVPVDSKPETEPTETIVEPELFDATQLDASIGKPLADFTADAEALGATVRVTVIDGIEQAVTMDFSVNRVNVSVEGGDGPDAIVVAVNGVG